MNTIKITWQGLGGEGIKTAALVLARAINETPYFSQSFPEYGPERSGAITRAYTRISDREILSHYPIIHADILISTFNNFKTNTLAIIAGDKLEKKDQIFYLPAKNIAAKFNSTHFNLPLVGALIAILEKNYSLDSKLILNSFEKTTKINPAIIQAGYSQLKTIL
jgi:pyruvate ferredoxin oxidoreductase gamma subunit